MWYYDGDKLRNLIAQREQSIPEFARDAGVSNFTVYRAINGVQARTKSLGKIANALGCETPRALVKEKVDR